MAEKTAPVEPVAAGAGTKQLIAKDSTPHQV
jgi:hypothetical protein